MNKTVVRRLVSASRPEVYRALIDRDLVVRWMSPPDMTMTVHEFDPKERGRVRISLSYIDTSTPGKTIENVDSYHGWFEKLVPDELLVEHVEFETEDAAMQGISTITIALRDEGKGTVVTATHADLPSGLSAADNELGWQLSLDQLASLVESGV